MAWNSLEIVAPVYNDWESFAILVERLDLVLADARLSANITAIDDGSNTTMQPEAIQRNTLRAIRKIDVVRLACNMGNQRAVAVGIVLVAKKQTDSLVIVMDSDGDDRPEDVIALVRKANEVGTGIVCAHRGKRSENLSFRIWYGLYKVAFKLMTGKVIDFGNFMAITKTALTMLAHHPSLWNNLPATVVLSRISLTRLYTERGTRFHGKPKMNFVSLLIHGLSAISVFLDIFLVRLLCGLAVVMAGALIATAIIIFIRFFTDFATAGWATAAAGPLVVVFLTSLFVAALATLGLLSNRSALQTVPFTDASRFIVSTTTVYHRSATPALLGQT